jgi:3-hydroxyisobutyrate dehydrogenase-like beta-hydroxyacid dehydrogenase
MAATPTVGLIGTGHMGSAVGRRLLSQGVRVVACVADRSERSRTLASDAGIDLLDDLAAVLRDAEVVLSIVPPAAARAVADDLAGAAAAFDGADLDEVLVVDANAIAPATARGVAATLTAAGLGAADGGIIGPPPRDGVTPRLYVSGDTLAPVLGLGRHGLDVRPVPGGVGAASALKLSYAALTKGTAAIAIQLLVAAERAGITEPLLDELHGSLPHHLDALERQLPGVPAKARRWVGEMEEIEAAFQAAGLPPGTFAGVAELYRWVGAHPLAEEAPETRDADRDLRAVIRALAAGLDA